MSTCASIIKQRFSTQRVVPKALTVNLIPIIRFLRVHSLAQSSPLRLVFEATTKLLHQNLSDAALGAVSMVRPLFFRSFMTVRLQVSFGRPLFRFPCGVQRRAVLVKELGGMRKTCPSHVQRPVWMISVIIRMLTNVDS